MRPFKKRSQGARKKAHYFKELRKVPSVYPVKFKRNNVVISGLLPSPYGTQGISGGLFEITTGTSDSQRLGATIKIRGFRMRLNMQSNTTGITFVRLALVAKKQTNSTLEDTNTSTLLKSDDPANPFKSFSASNDGRYNIGAKYNNDGYHIFWTKTIKLGPAAEGGGISTDLPGYCYIDRYFKWNKYVTYDPDVDGSQNKVPSSTIPFLVGCVDNPIRTTGDAAITTVPSYCGDFIVYFSDAANQK